MTNAAAALPTLLAAPRSSTAPAAGLGATKGKALARMTPERAETATEGRLPWLVRHLLCSGKANSAATGGRVIRAKSAPLDWEPHTASRASLSSEDVAASEMQRKAEQAQKLRATVARRRHLRQPEHILEHYEQMAEKLEREIEASEGVTRCDLHLGTPLPCTPAAPGGALRRRGAPEVVPMLPIESVSQG
eukprot:CAMPEP_0177364176 /NCGR_PEP_ID=MMETSP0368-20130122/38644_1 /TAXON_ID=447022 ORGANISM="Scrippsiella hangoei-like, Strain SHHI-4" /NCGR_SAMPLE_ID=MMETSP0368 /ASSEMBLY_ACC=CAM_ASM_000363 /LENGTH=190 /DNA_ID=CAMNT_0018827007 /DNA_START=58 /DNA_END=627 /DNA_ORIENTATION=+